MEQIQQLSLCQFSNWQQSIEHTIAIIGVGCPSKDRVDGLAVFPLKDSFFVAIK